MKLDRGGGSYALDQLHVAPGPNFLINRCRRVESLARGACLPAPPDFISIKEEAPEQLGLELERPFQLRPRAQLAGVSSLTRLAGNSPRPGKTLLR